MIEVFVLNTHSGNLHISYSSYRVVIGVVDGLKSWISIVRGGDGAWHGRSGGAH